jgi:hypothetical protein
MPCFARESSLITRPRAQVTCKAVNVFSPYAMPCHVMLSCALDGQHTCVFACAALGIPAATCFHVASSIVTVGARHAGHASMYHCIYIHLSLVDLSMLDLLMLDLSMLSLSMPNLSMPNLSIHRATRSTRCKAHRAPTAISADDDTKANSSHILTPQVHLEYVGSSLNPQCLVPRHCSISSELVELYSW